MAIDDWAQSNPTIPPVPLVSYGYDSDGRVVNETLPGGTRSRTYTNGQLTGYDETVPGLTRATTLTYDATGRIATDTTGALTTVYAYDAGSQLVGVVPGTGNPTVWTYDALGRRASEKVGTAAATSYVYDAAGQLCWTTTKKLPASPSCAAPLTGAARFTWDGVGRLTGEYRTATNNIAYSYDAAGRLTGAVRVNGATTTTHSRGYEPDGLVASVDNTVVNATTTTLTSTTLDWDVTSGVPDLVALTKDGISTDLAGGPGGWATATTGLTPRPIGLDVLGSAIPTTGTTTLARNATYTAFGAPSGTNTFEPRLGYRGELTIDNQLYLRARSYQPSIARFASRDPRQGVNGTTTIAASYHYADNNPLNRTDPTGMRSTIDDDGFGVTIPVTVTPYFANPTTCTAMGCQGPLAVGGGGGSSGSWAGEQANPNEPTMSMEEASRLMHEITQGLLTEDPGGWTAGLCGSIDVAFVAAGELQGCLVASGGGLYAVGFVGAGAGAPSLGASVGGFSSNADVEKLRGWSVCFGGSVGEAAGAICGSIQYSDQSQQWVYTDAASLYVGAGPSLSPLGGETHVIYGKTGVTELFSWDWLKFWEWDLW